MICTFHSLCLRNPSALRGTDRFAGNFSIYDSARSRRSSSRKRSKAPGHFQHQTFSPGTIHGTISNADSFADTGCVLPSRPMIFYARTVARVYKKYQDLLNANNALDFDDLLLRTNAGDARSSTTAS